MSYTTCLPVVGLLYIILPLSVTTGCEPGAILLTASLTLPLCQPLEYSAALSAPPLSVVLPAPLALTLPTYL